MYSRMYVRGICFKDNCILLEKTKEKYQLPGGIVIEDEFLKDALVRNFEMKYGLPIEVRRGRVYDYNGTPLEYIYMVNILDKIMDTSLEWVPLDKWLEYPFYPIEVRDQILTHKPSFDEIEDILFIEQKEA